MGDGVVILLFALLDTGTDRIPRVKVPDNNSLTADSGHLSDLVVGVSEWRTHESGFDTGDSQDGLLGLVHRIVHWRGAKSDGDQTTEEMVYVH